jgi:hypothetical protein
VLVLDWLILLALVASARLLARTSSSVGRNLVPRQALIVSRRRRRDRQECSGTRASAIRRSASSTTTRREEPACGIRCQLDPISELIEDTKPDEVIIAIRRPQARRASA